MKLSGFLAFALLSISILSFGLTGAVNAQSVLPVSVTTDSSSYTTGNSIEIFCAPYCARTSYSPLDFIVPEALVFTIHS